MKKILKNTAKTKKYLEKLPKMYLVAYWARYGVREYPFSGKYLINENGIHIPLVWDYYDANGAKDEWHLIPITSTTTGVIWTWTQEKHIANLTAEAMNSFEGL